MCPWPRSRRASSATWPANTAIILAIELLAAAQGVDLRAPHLTSERLQRVMREIRARVPHYDIDHYLAPDIAAMADAVERRRDRRARAAVTSASDDSGRVRDIRRHVARRGGIPPPHAAGRVGRPRRGHRLQGDLRRFQRRSLASLGLQWHLLEEWVILANLFALLVGFTLLARHFEQSQVPHLLPRIPARRLEGRPGAAGGWCSCCPHSSTTSRRR